MPPSVPNPVPGRQEFAIDSEPPTACKAASPYAISCCWLAMISCAPAGAAVRVMPVAKQRLRDGDRALMMRCSHHHRHEVTIDVAGRTDVHGDHHSRHRLVVFAEESSFVGRQRLAPQRERIQASGKRDHRLKPAANKVRCYEGIHHRRRLPDLSAVLRSAQPEPIVKFDLFGSIAGFSICTSSFSAAPPGSHRSTFPGRR